MNGLTVGVASALANQPLLLAPSAVHHAVAAMRFLEARNTVDVRAESPLPSPRGDRDPGYDVHDGVAVIPVRGFLVQRLGSLRPWGDYVTGYDGIRQSLLNAVSDSSIRAIAFDINSPGGTTAGVFDLADTVREARASKPIWSILSESAYSAAYLIASQTSRIVVPRTGGAGSIGIIAMLFDISEALAKDGIKPIIMHYGKHKADITKAQLEGAKPGLLAELQQRIDMLGEMFVEAVAVGRRMDPDAIRATEARSYTAQDAVTVGLADTVQSPAAAMRDLIAKIKGI